MDGLFKIETISESGLNAVFQILNFIEANFRSKERKIFELLYPAPKIIYRGIDGVYSQVGIDKERHTIDSSLSIRIKESHLFDNDNEAFIKADYINRLVSILGEARKNCPERYKNFSDLQILADIQHHGGATCLVDFSKNILTSLWFACNMSRKDNKELDGILYCYNYMHDLIVQNNLSIVHQDEYEESIQNLVYNTYSIIDYCSDNQNRFRLWDPVAINNRIVKQDSIFLFGIEKFYTHNHDILAIVIPSEYKKSIREVLEQYFNITATTIYNDDMGLALANNKLMPFRDNAKSFIDRCYDDGFECMLQGNYYEALELLTAFDIKKPRDLNRKKKIELCYSLAVCYKNIASKNSNRLIYYRNAVQSYLSAIEMAEKVLENNSNEDPKYYSRKIVRAYNEVIELQYSIKDYLAGIEYCDRAISSLKRLETYNVDHAFNTKYIELTQVEFMLLNIIDSLSDKNDNIEDIITSYYKHARNVKKSLKSNGDSNRFDVILISMMSWFISLLKYSICKPEDIDKIENIIQRKNLDILTTKERECIHVDSSHYMEWDFSSLIDQVNECRFLNKKIKRIVHKVISHAIMIRDLFNAQARIVNKVL